ncbi:MAG TPA: hypothetical protein VLB47_09315, partial [Solirubrobacteraceae bacterium]|nr:hypothetical protein [Solirubrobacteraceae bacterium]
MTSVALGLALAVGASVALNASFLLQHAGSAGAAAITPLRPLATLRALLRSPLWAVGAAVGMAGWALHVTALSHAPLSLVQAFVAGGLALTVPMAAVGLGHRTRPDERRAAALMVAALVLLALGLHGTGRDAAFAAAALAAWLAALAFPAAALAALVRGPGRPAALGLAGGLLYGAADLAIKALTGVAATRGLEDVLASPWLPVAATLSVAAFFAFQRGLQAGRPVTIIALMTAATNAGSIAGGFVVFGDRLGATPALGAAHV